MKKLPLEEVLAGAGRLYSMPVTALEVMRLTDEPKIDTRALRDCIQVDPALTAKLLRVVNSSLYGLSGEVADLNQALALLGVNPLKLLVLGFSLPDNLLDGPSTETLSRYWTQTLSRAIAAREFAKRYWGKQEDEAFLAGLMQGIGQLVLIDLLGDPYTDLLNKLDASHEKTVDQIAELEKIAVGFDHRVLSAALLRQWGLPSRIWHAIQEVVTPKSLADLQPEDAVLAQSLRLAELTMHLVQRKCLNALPDLVEEGNAYCGMSRATLDDIVTGLEPQINQLAEAMTIEVESVYHFREVLLEAQTKMATLSEATVGSLLIAGSELSLNAPDETGEVLLAETRELSASIQEFLNRDQKQTTKRAPELVRDEPADDTAVDSKAIDPNDRAKVKAPHHAKSREGSQRLLKEAARQAEICRAKRRPLALVQMQVDALELISDDDMAIVTFQRWAMTSQWKDELRDASWYALGPDRLATLLPDKDRHAAVTLITSLQDAFLAEFDASIDAGVAAVELPPKGFPAEQLIEAAQRCLDAARDTGAPTVKSIEVY